MAVLESRVTTMETRHAETIKKLDDTLAAIGEDRREMAEERGILKQFKSQNQLLTGIVGFLAGALVTLLAAHVI